MLPDEDCMPEAQGLPAHHTGQPSERAVPGRQWLPRARWQYKVMPSQNHAVQSHGLTSGRCAVYAWLGATWSSDRIEHSRELSSGMASMLPSSRPAPSRFDVPFSPFAASLLLPLIPGAAAYAYVRPSVRLGGLKDELPCRAAAEKRMTPFVAELAGVRCLDLAA